MSVFIDLVVEESDLYIAVNKDLLDCPTEWKIDIDSKELKEWIHIQFRNLCGIEDENEMGIDTVHIVGEYTDDTILFLKKLYEVKVPRRLSLPKIL